MLAGSRSRSTLLVSCTEIAHGFTLPQVVSSQGQKAVSVIAWLRTEVNTINK